MLEITQEKLSKDAKKVAEKLGLVDWIEKR